MYQPYPSSGQPAGPLRPPVPAPVLTAVRLMYAGAAVSAVQLITGLVLIVADIGAAARGRFLGHSLTAPQAKPLVITVWILFGLVVMALWLWMARANGRGRNWARILSTALFVLATLQLLGTFSQPVSHAGFGVTVLYYLSIVLFVAAWLAGGAAVWLLWRPASGAFFEPRGLTQDGPASSCQVTTWVSDSARIGGGKPARSPRLTSTRSARTWWRATPCPAGQVSGIRSGPANGPASNLRECR